MSAEAHMAETSSNRLTASSFQVLLALADHPKHGWAILKDIESSSGSAMSLSPAFPWSVIEES